MYNDYGMLNYGFSSQNILPVAILFTPKTMLPFNKIEKFIVG